MSFDNSAAYNHTIIRIKDLLEESYQPLTIPQMATKLEVTPQTIRNNLPAAIRAGFVRQTNLKIGKAYTFESTRKQTSLLPAVIINGEPIPIRDAFIRYTTNLPNPPVAKAAASIVNLYHLVIKFMNEEEKMAYSEKVSRLKAEKVKLREYRDAIRSLLELMNSMLNNEHLWEPKDLVKHLLIMDEDMDEVKIKSYLDKVNNGSN